MTNIESYLHDGANWQAQAVLAYLRSQAFRMRDCSTEYIITPEIEVGRYENCREQGYVFRLRIGIDVVMNYAVYEHRNSDRLIVMMSPRKSIDTPSVNEIYNGRESKYDYDQSFEYGEIVACGDYILDDMKILIQDWFEKNPSFTKTGNKAIEDGFKNVIRNK